MKLKKLGKYFTKGLQAGVLATALIAGNVSCSQPAGGNDTEFTGGNGGNGDQGDKEQETGWRQPAYMNVTEEFGGQRFVEEKTNWLNDKQGYTKFTAHCDDANQYIDGKVAELQELWQETNTGSVLSDQINTALNNFNNGTSIDEKINNNYTALAPVLVTIENDLLNDTVDYYRYKTSYQKLAANAYNKSLGHGENSQDSRVLTNQEMKNLRENLFVKELVWANLSYNDLTVTKAQEIMNDSLVAIANNTNTDQGLLKKFIELALVNESLYGLADLAKFDNVVSSKARFREWSILENIIYQEHNNTQTQGIDDRTM
ncbi:MAG: hypothetical protein HDR33_04410 [Treponema sp.]|nr:hypothetical protein [Treponema sp.]